MPSYVSDEGKMREVLSERVCDKAQEVPEFRLFYVSV